MKAKMFVKIACLGNCLLLPNLTYAQDYKGPMAAGETRYFAPVYTSNYSILALSVNGPTEGYPLTLEIGGNCNDDPNPFDLKEDLYAPGNIKSRGTTKGVLCEWTTITVTNTSGKDISYVDLDARIM